MKAILLILLVIAAFLLFSSLREHLVGQQDEQGTMPFDPTACSDGHGKTRRCANGAAPVNGVCADGSQFIPRCADNGPATTCPAGSTLVAPGKCCETGKTYDASTQMCRAAGPTGGASSSGPTGPTGTTQGGATGAAGFSPSGPTGSATGAYNSAYFGGGPNGGTTGSAGTQGTTGAFNAGTTGSAGSSAGAAAAAAAYAAAMAVRGPNAGDGPGYGGGPLGDSTTRMYPSLIGGGVSGGVGGTGAAGSAAGTLGGTDSGLGFAASSLTSLPNAGTMGYDSNSQYLPTSRQPGDFDVVPNPYLQGGAFSTSSYSAKTEPVPFLNDFSKFFH
uniref:Uncharacterized protein n=1 Tax=viral metagenome TaxID=1070528 RepID=A0A6C0J3I5_9ZZZZ